MTYCCILAVPFDNNTHPQYNNLIMEKAPDFQILNHTADLGMKVRGKDLEELFISAAAALSALLVNWNNNRVAKEVPISVEGEDLIDTFIRWLGEILYLFEGERLIFTSTSRFTLSAETHLDAIAIAVPFDPTKDEILHDIKAVTYHMAAVNRTNNGWEATVIFDL